MKDARLLLFCLVSLGGFSAIDAGAAKLESRHCERIADAIWHVEGGRKARVPYGILAVPVRSQAEARRVCLNTVRNTWERWEADGNPGDFLDYLANRYVPPSVDPVGNRNWRRNIRARLKES